MTEPTNNTPSDANGSGNQPGAGTFTPEQQERINELLGERIKREREKYKDYEELKSAAQKWAEMEERQKSEEQKLREALEKERAEKQTAIEQANSRLIEAVFIQEATIAGVKFPRDAFLLAKAEQLPFEMNGTEVTGVKEAVAKLVQSGRLVLAKPTAPNMDGGAGNGERSTERAVTLTEDEKATAKKMGLTEQQYAEAKQASRR